MLDLLGGPDVITLTVPFEPVAKGRPRFVKATGHAYTPAKTALGEWQIRQAFLDSGQGQLQGPLRLTLCAYVSMPQGIAKRDRATALPVRRPDLDQYIKTALDALNTHAFGDDSQVVEIIARKRYGVPPRWEITLERI